MEPAVPGDDLTMIRRLLRRAAIVASVLLLAATAPVSITGQLLAYQDGFVFFTSGDGFRVAPNVLILDEKSRKPGALIPMPRMYARAVFDTSGTVTELDLSRDPLPLEPLPDEVAKFAVVASPRYPNPELARPATTTENGVSQTFSGKLVLLTMTVQVPPTTPLTANVYITTDTDAWNPQAIQMDRVDALHFRISRRIASGTVLHYLYTRGSLQSEERAENGLEREPRQLIVSDADVRAVNDVVYSWADTSTGGQSAQPNALPTPYNPIPFRNLPGGIPTPHPR